MVSKKKKSKKHWLYLTCQLPECQHKFKSERYRKYCHYKCQRKANANFSKLRYAEMREVVLKARGVIE